MENETVLYIMDYPMKTLARNNFSSRLMKTLLIVNIALQSLFFTCYPVFSQYNTPFEEETFKLYKEQKGNVYDLLNAVNYDEEFYGKGKKAIDDYVKDLKSKNIQLKPLKKQIQIIYKTTHAKFFKKYEAKAFFNNIFENGQYNCVTASALYALLFDEFKINYSIRETPVHVYLIADTSGLQTLIESTLPGSGVMSFNDKFKKDYITYLNVNKIISDSEFQNSTTDELFREFYSKDKSISLWELAALQYYNKGIFLMEEEKYAGAASYLEKALLIYPSNNIRYNHYAAIQNALVNDISKKLFDGNLFGQLILSSFTDSSLVHLMAEYFDNVAVELCVKSPDIERFNEFYLDALSQYSLEDIPAIIVHKYHYYKAYYYGLKGNYPVALAEIKKSYDLNRENLMVKAFAQEIAIKHLLIESNYKRQIDSMEYYFAELPFLSEVRLFQQQYVYYYMKVISDCFMYNETAEGTKYYNRFLTAIDKYGIQYYSEDHISYGIGVMAYYYANTNDFPKALDIVNVGIKLSPESLQLRKLKNQMAMAIQMARNAKTYTTYNTSYPSDFEVVYAKSNYKTPEELKDDVDKRFPGKWRAVSIIIEDMEQKLSKKESFELVAEENKDCTYTQNGKTEKGKWAYRPKSKCIYFVPDYNKDNYKVFKIKEVSDDRIVLLPYKDQKTPSPYQYVLKPF